MIRGIGFGLIVCGASACGFLLAADLRRKMRLAHSLKMAFNRMKWELEFRLATLGEVFQLAAENAETPISALFVALSTAVSEHPATSLQEHMKNAMPNCENCLPESLCAILTELSSDLGRQDIESQSIALELAIRRTEELENTLRERTQERSRVYRVIGICVGFALAILLI